MKERVAWWDNMKFVLITLVVVGHFANQFTGESDVYKSIYLFIYAFHMPVFIFLSGMFHRDTGIVRKCLYYISAGFVAKIVLFITNSACGKPYDFRVLSDGGIPWFMFVLAIFTVLMYLLRGQNKRYLLLASLVLACFAGYDQTIGDWLYISRVIVFFPFYLLGTMVNGEKLMEIKKKYKSVVWISAMILVVWAVLSVTCLDGIYKIRYMFSGRNPFSPYYPTWGGLVRLLCYGISLLTGAALMFVVPMKKIQGISKMGQNSIDVYVWHWILYLLLERWFHIQQLVQLGVGGKLAFLFVAVLISVVASQGYIFSFPLAQIKRMIEPKKEEITN